MIKRIICFVLSVMLTSFIQFSDVMADNTPETHVTSLSDSNVLNTIEIMKAIGITDAVGGNSLSFTRAEFLYDIMRLTGYAPASVTESPFSDVSVSSYYAGAVKYALDTKIISKSDNFYPNNPIRLAEACKIAVSALGYDYYALTNGGFPTGYIVAAENADLLLGVNRNDVLTSADALTLINNFMFAGVYTPSAYKDADGGTTIISKGDSVLKHYHNVDVLEDAIVTSTVFTGLYESGSACYKSWIEINNMAYKYNGSSVDMIGKCVDVYYRVGSSVNTALYLEEDLTSVIKMQSRDIINLDKQYVEYSTGSKDKKLKLIQSPSFIYNECADTKLTVDYLETTDGELTFIDNNSDNVYDVIYIKESIVSVAESVNVYDNTIICEDNTIVNFNLDDIKYYIEKDGVECDISQLKVGDVLWIYKSHSPLNVFSIYVSSKQKISGTVTEINKSGNLLYIDGVAYVYNKSFENNGLSLCELGAKVTVLLNSLDQIAACTQNDAKTEYGYFINIRKIGNIDESIYVKMLDGKGKIEIYTIGESVIFDGTKTKSEEVFKKLSESGEQIIRYEASTEKVLKMIDTQNHKGIVDENASSDDRLSLFEFPLSSPYLNSNIAYIPGSMMFHPHFQASASTKVFKIIEDDKVDEDLRYTVVSPSYFSTIKFVPRKDFEAYDVEETGQTGAIVYRAGVGDTTVNQESNSGIVYSANPALTPEGEKAVALVVYKSEKYQKFYIEDENVLKTISEDASFTNIPINPGDYVKYNIGARNDITGITRDFDYEGKKVLNKFEQHMLYGYYYGTVYDCREGLISLMPENIKNVDEALTDGAYRYRFKLPGSLTVYDSRMGTIYQGTPDDIITYLQSESDCNKILLRMYEGTIRDAVVFK